MNLSGNLTPITFGLAAIGSGIGAGLVFASGIAWAIYVVVAKPLILKYGSFPTTALTVSIAGAGARHWSAAHGRQGWQAMR
jgi:drug/metabolite transporter (DMT)-like permease